MSVLQVRLIDRVVPRSRISDLALISAGAGLTAVLAQIQIPMYPVPMTLQTFAVLLIAAAMGPWRALSSMGLYVALGAAGLPVFAGAKALGQVVPTAGYLFGFAVAAGVVGLVASSCVGEFSSRQRSYLSLWRWLACGRTRHEHSAGDSGWSSAIPNW